MGGSGSKPDLGGSLPPSGVFVGAFPPPLLLPTLSWGHFPLLLPRNIPPNIDPRCNKHPHPFHKRGPVFQLGFGEWDSILLPPQPLWLPRNPLISLPGSALLQVRDWLFPPLFPALSVFPCQENTGSRGSRRTMSMEPPSSEMGGLPVLPTPARSRELFLLGVVLQRLFVRVFLALFLPFHCLLPPELIHT